MQYATRPAAFGSGACPCAASGIEVDGTDSTRMDRHIAACAVFHRRPGWVGAGWSPDRSRFYLLDSDAGLIWSWDFNYEIGSPRAAAPLVADVGRGVSMGSPWTWKAAYGFPCTALRRHVHSPQRAPCWTFTGPVIRHTSACLMGENEDVLCVASAQQDSAAAGVDGLLLSLDVGSEVRRPTCHWMSF